MDAKDLRTEPAVSERNNDGSKYSQSGGIALHCDRNKSYQDIGSNSLGKVDVPNARPCAVIGPDRVVPPVAVSEAYHLKKGPAEPWPCMDNAYRRPPEYPHKFTSFQNPTRNISPRQTFQENMQRIMVPPTYSSIKINDDTNYAQISDRSNGLSKNIKLNMPPEAKFCDVPYAVNPTNNEQKSVRNPEMCLPSVNPTVTRTAPHGWPPGSVNLRSTRMYGAPELYQYQEYPSCAGPRPVVPRPHRTVPEEQGYPYDPYYQEGNIRFKPYPTVKERYPQQRYEYISNYSNPFHPPPGFPTHKYDLQKSMPPHPYPPYPPIKYLDSRVAEPVMEGYQRNPQGNYNIQYRNQVIHPNYGPVIGNCPQNKMHSYPSDAHIKTIAPNKLPFDNNTKAYIEYENNRPKIYPPSESYFVNEMARMPMKSQVIMPNYPALNVHNLPPNSYYKKDQHMKNYDHMAHFRNMDPNINVHNPMSRHAPVFSPNTLAISPTDSNASNDTSQTLGTSQEDCGYVSQSSTASVRSMDSGINRIPNDYLRKYYDSRYGPIVRTSPMMSKSQLNSNNNVSKDKKQIDVRQFLQMWNEGDEEAEENSSKEIINQTGSSDKTSFGKTHEAMNNQEQLYVLGLVNVPSEELAKYEHIQKVSKLPENIKGYNSIELLNQFEEVIESSNMNNYKSPTPKEFQMSMKGSLPKQMMGVVPPRPVSPLDVEAKISQSVIHKEVGCNFEIKPCSPKMLNVEVAAPVQNILAERSIEKVANPVMIKSPMLNGLGENMDCNIMKRSDHHLNINENVRIPSCKMINTQYSNGNAMDSMKSTYSLQDLESNSGLCLASLPRLDNDIELNFPEVNQQFINANKGDTNILTPSLRDLPTLDVLEQSDNHTKDKFDSIHSSGPENDVNKSPYVIDSEKEFSKLSKYRKTKTNSTEPKESKIHQSISAIRTDSVIIKNPENIKKYDENLDFSSNSLCKPVSDIQQAPINLTSQGSILSNRERESEKNDSLEVNNEKQMPVEIAIDFSLNKTVTLENTDYIETKNESQIINSPTDDIEEESVKKIMKKDNLSESTSLLPMFSDNKNLISMDKVNENCSPSHGKDSQNMNEVMNKNDEKTDFEEISLSDRNFKETDSDINKCGSDNISTSKSRSVSNNAIPDNKSFSDIKCDIEVKGTHNDKDKMLEYESNKSSKEKTKELSEYKSEDNIENWPEEKTNDPSESKTGELIEVQIDKWSDGKTDELSAYKTDEFSENKKDKKSKHKTEGFLDDEMDKWPEDESDNVVKDKIDDWTEDKMYKWPENKTHELLEAETNKWLDDKSDEFVVDKSDEFVEDKSDEIVENKSDKLLEAETDKWSEDETGEFVENKTDKCLEAETNKWLEDKTDEFVEDKSDKLLEAKTDKWQEDETAALVEDKTDKCLEAETVKWLGDKTNDFVKDKSDKLLEAETDKWPEDEIVEDKKDKCLEAETDNWPEDKTDKFVEHKTDNFLEAEVDKWPKDEIDEFVQDKTETYLQAETDKWPDNKTDEFVEQKADTFLEAETDKWPDGKSGEFSEGKIDTWPEDEMIGFVKDKIDKWSDDKTDGIVKDNTDNILEAEMDKWPKDKTDGFVENKTDEFSEGKIDTWPEDKMVGFVEDKTDKWPENKTGELSESNEDKSEEKNDVSSKYKAVELPEYKIDELTEYKIDKSSEYKAVELSDYKIDELSEDKIGAFSEAKMDEYSEYEKDERSENITDDLLDEAESENEKESFTKQNYEISSDEIAMNMARVEESCESHKLIVKPTPVNTRFDLTTDVNGLDKIDNSKVTEQAQVQISNKHSNNLNENLFRDDFDNSDLLRSENTSNFQSVTSSGNVIDIRYDKIAVNESTQFLENVTDYVSKQHNIIDHSEDLQKPVTSSQCKVKTAIHKIEREKPLRYLSYGSKEMYSPSIQKLLMFTEGNTNNMIRKTGIRSNDSRVDYTRTVHTTPINEKDSVDHVFNIAKKEQLEKCSENITDVKQELSRKTVTEIIDDSECSAYILDNSIEETINDDSFECQDSSQIQTINFDNKEELAIDEDNPANSVLGIADNLNEKEVIDTSYGSEPCNSSHEDVSINLETQINIDIENQYEVADTTDLTSYEEAFGELQEVSEQCEEQAENKNSVLELSNFERVQHSCNRIQANEMANKCHSLKRSLSDSALNMYNNNERPKPTNEENLQFIWPFKRRKLNNVENDLLAQNLCNIIHHNRRNSVSSFYNEENVSFCILIDNSCILTEDDNEEPEKMGFTELTEECIAEIQNSCAKHDENAEPLTEFTTSPQQENACDYSDTYVVEEEKTLEESWVEDVACVETVISDDIAEDIEICGPSSPKEDGLSDNDESGVFSSSSEHTDKVKFIYGDKMGNDDAQFVETLYNTPQMDVNRTLYNREMHVSGEYNKYYDNDSLEKMLSESNEPQLSPYVPEYMDSMFSSAIINHKEVPENKENVNVETFPPFQSKSNALDIVVDINVDKIEHENMHSIEIFAKSRDDTLHSCESSVDDVFTYNHKNEDNIYSTSSSPEVSSTTSEEKNSGILLKITNYKGSRISQINDISSVNKRSSCKFTEDKDYLQSHSGFPSNRPLLTKAAQKYIPPLKESIRDLKVKLTLPQHSLMKLKQLKISKDEPKVKTQLASIPRIPKKPKPKFEDVLKSIDEIQFKMHKEKTKKTKKSIPKVVIKKNVNGSHYASTSHKDDFNPDLTGRKWQPWVFIEKSHFIDKMAIKKKTKAIYSHRKRTYVLAEKFQKYKSASSAKFVISPPISDNPSTGLKYTIRLKHNY